MKKTIALLLVFAFIFAFAACGKKEEAKETVTVTFDTDGGDTIEAQTIEKGSAVVKPSTPKKSGYIFDKWTLNGSEYEFGTAVNEDITLKALWVDPNSGSGSGSSGGSGGSEDSGKKDEEIKVESLKWRTIGTGYRKSVKETLLSAYLLHLLKTRSLSHPQIHPSPLLTKRA